MTNSNTKKENIFFSLVFLAFYLFTVSASGHLGIKMDFLSFGGLISQSRVYPDILFALVLCCAILNSKRRAVVLGIIFGFIVDVTGTAPMLTPLIYCICASFAYKLSTTVAGRGAVNAILVALVLLLAKALVSTFFLLGTWHSISFTDILFGAVLPEYIYNVVVVGIVYVILKFLMRIFSIEELI